MRGHGNLPLLETVEKGTRLVCDTKICWLRAKRPHETRFLGVSSEKIEAGHHGVFIFMDGDAPEDIIISAGTHSHYAKFLPDFEEYLESLGERESCK